MGSEEKKEQEKKDLLPWDAGGKTSAGFVPSESSKASSAWGFPSASGC